MKLHEKMAAKLAKTYLVKLRVSEEQADEWAQRHAALLTREQLMQVQLQINLLKKYYPPKQKAPPKETPPDSSE